MNKLLARLISIRLPWRRFDKADARDLYYCYRLLLQREPDKGGWEYWLGMINDNQIDLRTLVDGFLSLEEFQNIQESGRAIQLVDLDTFTLYVRQNDFFVGAVIAREKIYEPAVTTMIRELLGPGDSFVDIGANIGYFTCMAASLVGPKGRVFAFEPNPDNVNLIRQSIVANDFTNIQLYPFAVAEAAQTFKLDVTSSSSNARIIDFSPEAVPGVNTPVIVEAVTLDEALLDVPRIDLIKLDIEGAEPRAWQGMQQLVQQHRPIVIFEYSPELLQVTSHIAPEEFLDEIIDVGYDLYILSTTEGRSQTSQNKQQVVLAQTQAGDTHLDLVAFPK